MGSSSSEIKSEIKSAMITDISQSCSPSAQTVQRMEDNIFRTKGCRNVLFGQSSESTSRCKMESVTDVIVKAAVAQENKQMTAMSLTGGNQKSKQSTSVETDVRTFLAQKCPASLNDEQVISGNTFEIDCTGNSENPFALNAKGEDENDPEATTVSFMQNANAQTLCEMSQALKAASDVITKQKNKQAMGAGGVMGMVASDLIGMFGNPAVIVGIVVVVISMVAVKMMIKKK